MNPFEDIQIKNEIIFDNKIEIWNEKIGKKRNTYTSGWNISELLLKEHVKNIKKKNGCNGTVKKMIVDSTEKIVIHLQGNHSDFMLNYLINQGINDKNIYMKG